MTMTRTQAVLAMIKDVVYENSGGIKLSALIPEVMEKCHDDEWELPSLDEIEIARIFAAAIASPSSGVTIHSYYFNRRLQGFVHSRESRRSGPFTVDEGNSNNEQLYIDIDGYGTVGIEIGAAGIDINIYIPHVRDTSVAHCSADMNDLSGLDSNYD